MALLLRRLEKDDEGVFGQLLDETGVFLGVTCERPDNGNQKMGCIPVGEYEANPFLSPHNGKCFLLQEVPDRSMIEIHKGNTIEDTDGCILVGRAMGVVNGLKAITGSEYTLNRLLGLFPEGFTLRIIEDL